MPSDFAGYFLPDDSLPFPGGQAFATTHPTLGTPVLLRRFRAEWLQPADTVDTFVARMRTAFSASHTNLIHLIDAGQIDGQPYAVTEPFDGTSLETLVKDIGPMPTILAASFVRQAALGLDAIHDRGLVHGDIRPAHLLVGPLITSSRLRPDGTHIQRPGPEAVAKLSDFGLVPVRPMSREWAAQDPLASDVLAYLPPERIDAVLLTPAGDIYGLGATLFCLLTGRAPFEAPSSDEVVNRIVTDEPAPLATLRPDLPLGLVDLVQQMLARNPADRPANAVDVAGALAPFAKAGPMPTGVDTATTPITIHEPEHTFAVVSESAPPAAKKPGGMTAEDRKRLKMWFIIGGVFWGLALILWLVLLNQSGCFGNADSDNSSKTDDVPRKKKR